VEGIFGGGELDCAFGIADDTEMKIIKHDVMDQVSCLWCRCQHG